MIKNLKIYLLVFFFKLNKFLEVNKDKYYYSNLLENEHNELIFTFDDSSDDIFNINSDNINSFDNIVDDELNDISYILDLVFHYKVDLIKKINLFSIKINIFIYIYNHFIKYGKSTTFFKNFLNIQNIQK